MVRIPLIVASFSVLALHAAPAAASCTLVETNIYMTVPADGATGIPPDARIFVVGVPEQSVTVNGVASEVDGVAGWRPSNLVAGENVVTLNADEFRFDVDPDAELSPPEAPTVVSAEYELGPDPAWLESKCVELAVQRDCFDTGDPQWVKFDVGEPQGVAGWFVAAAGRGSLPWPASCGPPVWMSYAGEDFNGCFELRAMGLDGSLSAPTEYCIPDEAPDMGHNADVGTDLGGEDNSDLGGGDVGGSGDPDPNGCSTVSSSTPLAGLILLAVFGVGRRRTRRE